MVGTQLYIYALCIMHNILIKTVYYTCKLNITIFQKSIKLNSFIQNIKRRHNILK